MLPWKADLAGRIDERTIESTVLRDNPLGDPHERPIWVYLPPGYDTSDRRYPVVYTIQGFTGHVMMWANRAPWRQPYPELADGVFARGEAPPAIVVYVDCWTRLGGSQYVDSHGHGAYHTYLCEEVVPWVDSRYRTIPGRDHRAIAGKSSGGYGAMITPMLRPDVFGSLATHAGDALFETLYLPTFPLMARVLRDSYDGSFDRFLADFFTRPPLSREGDEELIITYANAASYSANPDGTVDIPFDDTGALIPRVWERWLALDPVRMAGTESGAAALRSLNAMWIDAGTADEYYLDLGAVAFRRAVAAAGLPDDRVYFELFEGKHGGIEYRYPLALAWLCERFPS
ncbi:alpha/beta hydrolase [Rhizohabitans arisaemae]|uniref:alpha/beta hydrolase n=1 Tax=Rhizohabitans arisaemae TaxID=2720610 RepID=UPI0024B194C6|nr:alpha/beta hydrolase-fold protein [Rhizohabitans arisaemae]